jgi:hypothetical protein
MADVAQTQISPAISLFIAFSSVEDSVPLRMPLPLAVSDRGGPTAFFVIQRTRKLSNQRTVHRRPIFSITPVGAMPIQ